VSGVSIVALLLAGDTGRPLDLRRIVSGFGAALVLWLTALATLV
jgi:hypothetical protein